MLIPQLTQYTPMEIVGKIIVPVSQDYPEVLWFADKNVAVTKEGGTNSNKGWTHALSETINTQGQSVIAVGPNNGKYIELERMLSSIVFFHLFYEGTEGAYEKLTSVQKTPGKLTYESFKEIHKLARLIAKDESSYTTVVAMLVYSDLGKTPTANANAKKFLIQQPDHDDFIEAVLSGNPEIITKIIPSFSKFTREIQIFMHNAANAMKIHLGHVLHLEGGEKMFSAYEKAVKEGVVSPDVLNFAYLIQLCDVAASAAHVNKEGSLAFTENTFRGYQLMKTQCLESIQKGTLKREALYNYLRERGTQLGLVANTPAHQVLIRLGCMLRLYGEKDGEYLEKAFKTLSPSDQLLLTEQFGIESGINTWNRNPTYLPAVLVNLAKFSEPTEPYELKISRALQGAVCIARVLEKYGSIPENKNSTYPLNLNNLAGIATKNPELFNAETFDPGFFNIDEKNSIVENIIEDHVMQKPTSESIFDSKLVKRIAVTAGVAGGLFLLYKIFTAHRNLLDNPSSTVSSKLPKP